MTKFIRTLNHCALAGLLFTAAIQAAPLKNEDIIKLSDAGLGEEILLGKIAKSESEFDTSPDALIKLKEHNVSQRVIAAMISGPDTGKSPAPAPANVNDQLIPPQAAPFGPPPGRGGISALRILNEGKDLVIPSTQPEMVARPFAGGYFKLLGPSAKTRVKSGILEFVVPVPANANPDSSCVLTRWERRSSGNREIKATTGGFISAGTGFPKERIIAVSFTKIEGDAASALPIEYYRMKTNEALPAGEYAIRLNGQWHDFGVD